MASITAGAAIRYPSRPPANANALLMVRVTTSLVGKLIDQRHGAGLRGELAVGLVDDQHSAGHRGEQAAQIGKRNALSGRVVRAGHEDHVGLAFGDRGHGHIHVEAEVLSAGGLDPLGRVPSEMMGCIE